MMNHQPSPSQHRVPKFEQCPHMPLRDSSFGFGKSLKLTNSISCRSEQGERSRTAGGACHIGSFVERSTVDGVGNALNDQALGAKPVESVARENAMEMEANLML